MMLTKEKEKNVIRRGVTRQPVPRSCISLHLFSSTSRLLHAFSPPHFWPKLQPRLRRVCVLLNQGVESMRTAI
ncbi:hypothetical protein Y1Q_0011651 [Alligator mississippiensis]|uniref:Uncharacterized protein n=1 Tax=Alligator mississippiensis TaxID=8496 RepID=A0A151M0L7_ALLMI|nr:hypothetical protein Y1Q_0011651 [Alligator mississippiensis]